MAARPPPVARAALAPCRPQRATAGAGRGATAPWRGAHAARLPLPLRARSFLVSDDEEEYEAVEDIPLDTLAVGRRVGSGSFGEVFRGELDDPAGGDEPIDVVLKKRKLSLNAQRFFRFEAATWRRLRGNAGLAPFLGVAGADAYLVWRDAGLTTLESVLQRARDARTRAAPMAPLADALCLSLGDASDADSDDEDADADASSSSDDDDEEDDSDAAGLLVLQTLARRLLAAVSAVHAAGVVHRDVKPGNILISDEGEVLLIDLGAAADLVAGVNWDPDEAVFDPLYGPPEQYLEFPAAAAGRGALPVKLAWLAANPDLFDAYSCGLVLLQAGVPYCRAGDRMRRLKAFLTSGQGTLDEWRRRQPSIAEPDFGLLDADGGAGWEVMRGLLAPRESRMSIAKALKHRFLALPKSVAAKAKKKRGKASKGKKR